MSTPKSITDLLLKNPLTVSAPVRLELGGTWDISGFALSYEWIKPVTVNFALDLRTTVTLSAYTPGKIKIINKEEESEFSLFETDFTGSQRLLHMIASHYGFDGYTIELDYEAPSRSGLGGSGTVAVVLVSALEHIKFLLEKKDPSKISRQKIVYLAHLLEASLGFSITGLQDQCAAMYGGINLWTWQYSKNNKFIKRAILSDHDATELENRIVVAYLATPHNLSDTNSQNIRSFFSLKDRLDWIKFNQNTMEFSNAIKSKNWKKAIKCIQFENQFRQKITEGRLLPIGFELWEIAKQTNAGFSTCGAGGGGCVWAITETPEEKQKLASQFSNIVGPENILNSKLDFQGIIFS